MRKSLGIAGGIATLALVGGMAAPAFADTTPGQNVHATVVVQTTISISGVTSNLDFGNVIPGNSKSLPGAQSITISTNSSHGASLLLSANNGGFHANVGGVDVIPDDAVSVTSLGKTVSVRDDGTPVDAADVGIGTHTVTQDWTLAVPITTPADPTGIFADFTLAALAG